MRAAVAMATLVVVYLSGCVPARSPGSPSSVLPLTSVRLYETGVGYFERSGVLSPSERTGLPVPASHLDDALESLVVFTPGHSDPVRGLAFGSSVSRGMARAMAGLPTESETPITYLDLLTSLKGAHVELKARTGSYLGRLIDIESPKDAAPTPGGAAGQAPSSIVVLTDGAELVRVPMEEVKTVRPTDPAYATRLDAALDALSLHSAQSRKMLDVLGASRGPVTLGYVAETPVWRTTYRLVLDDDGRRGELQGWALVHNDTDEDWESVKVELVNGRPDSFLFPLAAPRYARRTLVHPDDQLSTVPQLLDKTADAVWGDNIDDASGSGGLGASGAGEGGGGYGEGIGLGSVGSLGHGSGTAGGIGGVSESNVLSVGQLARVRQAAGVEAGALFVYALPERLALRAHASVLAPFLQQPVDVESIAWIDQPGEPARTAVRFVNSTSQTLPAGTISFFGDGGFAGESSLDRLKPGELRFVRFGADLDVNVKTLPEKGKPTVDAIERLTYSERRADGALSADHGHHVRLRKPQRPRARRVPDALPPDQRQGHRRGRHRLRQRDVEPSRRDARRGEGARRARDRDRRRAVVGDSASRARVSRRSLRPPGSLPPTRRSRPKLLPDRASSRGRYATRSWPRRTSRRSRRSSSASVRTRRRSVESGVPPLRLSSSGDCSQPRTGTPWRASVSTGSRPRRRRGPRA